MKAQNMRARAPMASSEDMATPLESTADPFDGPPSQSVTSSPTESVLLRGLNPSQREAVAHDGGPLLVVAGAGSGKTRVLTHRIAYLVDQGVSPYEILAITFTNKAAEEMRQRVATLVGPVVARMWVSTFHSACVRILRRDAARLGFPSSFAIYDQADSRRLIAYVLSDLGVDPKKLSPRTVSSQISLAKNQCRTPEMLADAASHVLERRLAEAYAEYQARLQRAGAMDFDDLLGQTVRLFSEFPDVLEVYQQRFRHILVDEFQDTNQVQNRLIIMLAERHRNVFVVGDGDQSIYKFRGADLSNILQFEEAFPDVSSVVLDQNYRSSQNILTAANAVIANNLARRPKDLWTDAGTGESIRRFCGDDEQDEAQWVAHEISRLGRDYDVAYSDVAIFYRANAQSRVFEESLFRVGVPYKVIGGTKFYDRKEVKDALAYVRAAVNPADEVSVKRVVNVPKRGVGDTSISKLDAWARHRGITFFDALRDAPEAGVIGRAVRGLDEFRALIEELGEAVPSGPQQLIELILDRSGYVAELEAEHTIEAEGRIENLRELVSAAAEFATVADFLEQISLVADADQLPTDEAEGGAQTGEVLLMTIHAAKGLEFPVVFLTGMEEGVFPHSRTLGEPHEIEEERRLAYVGITRAMKRLYVTHTWARLLNGATNYNPLSRFVNEIPTELIEEVDGSRAITSRAQPTWDEVTPGSGWGSPRPRSTFGTPGSSPRREAVGSSSRGPRLVGSDQSALGIPGVSRGLGHLGSGGNPLAANVEPSPPNVEQHGFRPGDDVRHPAFGEGIILDIFGEGEKAEAVVRFPGVGEKRLLLSWAPLEKM